jgi:hypothetical protein
MVPHSLDLRLAFLPSLCSSSPTFIFLQDIRAFDIDQTCGSLCLSCALNLACNSSLRTNLAPNSGIVLEKVAEYFYYNYKNRNREDVPDMEIPPELCLELLMAADYLDSEFSQFIYQFIC